MPDYEGDYLLIATPSFEPWPGSMCCVVAKQFMPKKPGLATALWNSKLVSRPVLPFMSCLLPQTCYHTLPTKMCFK